MNGVNTYPTVRRVLSNLGIENFTSGGGHHTHLHVGFKTPTRVPVSVTGNLLSEVPAASETASTATEIGSLLKEAATVLAIADADVKSFAQATETGSANWAVYAAADAGAVLRLGLCQPVLKDFVASRKAESLGILGVVGDYLNRLEGRPAPVGPDAEVSVVVPPQHGRFYITPTDVAGGWPGYWYLGQADYGGKDQFTVRIRLGERVVHVMVFTTVVTGDSAAVSLCRKVHGSQVWRLADNGQFALDFSAWLAAHSGRPAGEISLPASVQFTFRSLPGAALGSASIASSPAVVTLDSSAAGHGWFIDSTPQDSVRPPQIKAITATQSLLAEDVTGDAPAPELMPVAGSTARYRAVISHCQEVDNPVLVPNSALYSLDAVGLVKNYLSRHGQQLKPRDSVATAVVAAPSSGSLHVGGVGLDGYITYQPSRGFRGNDKASVAVTVNGVRYLVRFTVRVVEVTRDGDCGPRQEASAAPIVVTWDSAELSFG